MAYPEIGKMMKSSKSLENAKQYPRKLSYEEGNPIALLHLKTYNQYVTDYYNVTDLKISKDLSCFITNYDFRLCRLSINRDRIIRNAPPPQERKCRFLPLECAGRPHSSQPFYCIVLVQPTLSAVGLQLDCSENVDEEAVEQWINEDSTLECCEVSSEDDIVSRVTCGSEERRNFEECPESDEENFVTHQKLSHDDALVHTEALLNYLEQEDKSIPAENMILRNLRNIIRRRVNEKQKQTSIISFFTEQ
ncbi:hypothetical protein AVEN_146430-1 [Araneus ventricosus]|uniref:Uncharacterized protein n=1 Tax=Araneus ventricosus TaxID=182803 RepID=A0A4Y2NGL9_ARAVE|nr:hypothetical protein AVEN_146430-1 [Araneus ventricosus]